MEPYDLGGALWRQRLLVVLVFLVTAAAVVLGVQVAPKSYTSTAVVSAAARADAPSSESLDAQRGTLAELASSRDVAESVSAALASQYGVDRDADGLRRAIEGEWLEGTVLIRVEVTDRDPEVAALVARLAVEALQTEVSVDATLVFTMTSRPLPPVTYSSPNLVVAGAAGLLLATVLACVAAVARDRRRATVDNGRVAEEAAGAPLLAHVWPPRDPTALPALYPGTAAADAFRHLRLSLEAEAAKDPVSLVVVAGVAGGETNVWVGANLAISLASVGRTVLLVDGRLDGPTGQQVADTPGTLGLFEVMNGAPLSDALSPGPVEGLTVLPAGDSGGAGAEALIETGFAPVMDEARDLFDVIIVLPPPMESGDDARIMAAGGSLLLAVPENTVSVASLRAYADRTRSVGARLLGVVLVGQRAERLVT